ncbi:MAG: amidohydrolase family protein [Clostridia bacterium]|nr:amidohydrolase family protein [Clostridia bacterium]
MSKLLIKNGRVWDGNKFFYADVLTEDKKIKKIAENVTEEAEYVIDAKGKIVSAGFIDTHIHIKGISCDAFGIPCEAACFPFGVTAAADASAGQGSKEMLDGMAVKTKVFVCPDVKDNKVDFTQIQSLINRYGDRVVGLKTFFDARAFEVRDITTVKEICDYAHKKGLIVMVHSIGTPVPMKELLETLGKGDIITHTYHGTEHNASVDNFKSVKEASSRGVIIDLGLAGHINTDFAVLKKGIECGAAPTVISSDITRASAFKRGGRYGMTMCMSICRYLGMSEEEILKAVTSAPAAALGMQEEWGILKEGSAADITILDYTNEPFDLTDFNGNRINCDMGYRAIMTISDSEIVYSD